MTAEPATEPQAPVLTAIADGIATITLNRPASYNAIDPGMAAALLAALHALERDAAVRAVVLRGAGPAFMAGGDIRGFGALLAAGDARPALASMIEDVHAVVLTLHRMPAPVIAAVHGACAGFGMSLMMAADLVLAAEDAVFTLAYCRLGTSPDGGATHALPRIVGQRRAMEIALLGDRFDAATAERWGLVNRVVPADALAPETAALAARLAAGPALALAATRRLLRDGAERGLEAQLRAEAESFVACAGTADFREGVAAFLGRRPPRFGGPRFGVAEGAPASGTASDEPG